MLQKPLRLTEMSGPYIEQWSPENKNPALREFINRCCNPEQVTYKTCMSIYLALKSIKREKKPRYSMDGFHEPKREKNSIFFLLSLLSRYLGFFLTEQAGCKQKG